MLTTDFVPDNFCSSSRETICGKLTDLLASWIYFISWLLNRIQYYGHFLQ